VIGDIDQLLQWHVEDPVSDDERRRNDVICENYQGILSSTFRNSSPPSSTTPASSTNAAASAKRPAPANPASTTFPRILPVRVAANRQAFQLRSTTKNTPALTQNPSLRYVNERADHSFAIDLDGAPRLAAGEFPLLCRSKAAFTSAFGSTCDVEAGSAVDGNGDDNYAILDVEGQILDVFGVPGVEGTHEYKDGRAVRLNGKQSAVWNPDHWFVAKDLTAFTYDPRRWSVARDLLLAPADDATTPDGSCVVGGPKS